jgi:hypothetical protein
LTDDLLDDGRLRRSAARTLVGPYLRLATGPSPHAGNLSFPELSHLTAFNPPAQCYSFEASCAVDKTSSIFLKASCLDSYELVKESRRFVRAAALRLPSARATEHKVTVGWRQVLFENFF